MGQENGLDAKEEIKNFHVALIWEDLPPDMRSKKSRSLSRESHGASGHAGILLSFNQHEPVAEMSSTVSSPGSESLCTGDSDSTLKLAQTHSSTFSLDIELSTCDFNFCKDLQPV